MITIRLKDGKEKEFESAVSLADAAKAISNSLGKNALVAKVNGELTDRSWMVQRWNSSRRRIRKVFSRCVIRRPM